MLRKGDIDSKGEKGEGKEGEAVLKLADIWRD